MLLWCVLKNLDFILGHHTRFLGTQWAGCWTTNQLIHTITSFLCVFSMFSRKYSLISSSSSSYLSPLSPILLSSSRVLPNYTSSSSSSSSSCSSTAINYFFTRKLYHTLPSSSSIHNVVNKSFTSCSYPSSFLSPYSKILSSTSSSFPYTTQAKNEVKKNRGVKRTKKGNGMYNCVRDLYVIMCVFVCVLWVCVDVCLRVYIYQWPSNHPCRGWFQ